jgi:hypothetical protein
MIVEPAERPGWGQTANVDSETARYLILTTPRHGAFYRAITLASRSGGLPPLESVDGAQIKRACEMYGVQFVGPLPRADSGRMSGSS